MSDVYDSLAPIYDAMEGERPFAGLVAARLEEVLAGDARFAGGAAPAVLDLGCGTGTLLKTLTEAHPAWRLCGVDVSAGMLAVARARPGAARVLWARARLPGPLPFGGRFELIGSFYDTLNHLPDLAALAATFRTVAGLLRPGGRFVFDLTNEVGFARGWRDRVTLEIGAWRLTSRLAYDAAAGVGRAEMRLTGRQETHPLTLAERCFAEADVRQLMADAGLRLQTVEPWCYADDESPSKTWFVATTSA